MCVLSCENQVLVKCREIGLGKIPIKACLCLDYLAQTALMFVDDLCVSLSSITLRLVKYLAWVTIIQAVWLTNSISL